MLPSLRESGSYGQSKGLDCDLAASASRCVPPLGSSQPFWGTREYPVSLKMNDSGGRGMKEEEEESCWASPSVTGLLDVGGVDTCWLNCITPSPWASVSPYVK